MLNVFMSGVVGRDDGMPVGFFVGDAVGFFVGESVVGCAVGAFVGT